jgi:alpha-glucoside transport system permease protein
MTESLGATVAEHRPRSVGVRRRRYLHLPIGRGIVHVILVFLMIVWFTPIVDLAASSFREQFNSAQSGWWTVVVSPIFSLYNYQEAFKDVKVGDSFFTSIAIAIPTTILTTFLSAIGGFALSRMAFWGRTTLSVALVAVLVVPPQVTLVPLLQLFSAVKIVGTVPAVWIFQVGFTVPFGIFLVRGFLGSIPGELIESAELDGASALRTFRSIVVPLSVPILASLAILQFLWSWNDLLIPLLFLGGSSLTAPLTVQVAGLAQSYNQGQSLLMASTFVSVALPLIIIVGLQRYFVRGILGGAIKG